MGPRIILHVRKKRGLVAFAAAAVFLIAATVAASERPPTRMSAVKLVVSPSNALVDQPVDVRLTGLRAGRKVTLEATTRDVTKKTWRSRLVVTANRSGAVSTRSNMKLFWAMRPVGKLGLPPHLFGPPIAPTPVTIRALVNGRRVASVVLTRRGAAAGVTYRDTTLSDEGFVGTYWAAPPGPPGPAVLQIGGSEGRHSYIPAAVLASHGYPTLSLAYFKEPGLPTTLKDIPLEYFAKALRWLAVQPGVDPQRVMILGVSRGGEGALLIGSTYPQLVYGVIASTPSDQVIGASPGPGDAWTLGGKPVPKGPIPVWQIAGPVLVTGGGRDAVWPSALAVRHIIERARQHGRTDVAGRIYAEAGHGVGWWVPNLPVIQGKIGRNVYIPFGGSPTANAQAYAAAWPLVLKFIRTLP
jgi:dienelactone hydrolase